MQIPGENAISCFRMYLEADAEREGQCDHDDPPGDGREQPPAEPDAAVGLVG